MERWLISVKLASLKSLSVYFDTDVESMSGLPPSRALEAFSAMVRYKSCASLS